MKHFIYVIICGLFLITLGACKASTSAPALDFSAFGGGGTPSGSGGSTAAPNPHPIPSTCADFTGRYQVNMDLFNLKQKGCSQLVWNNEPTYYNKGSTYTYSADGIERFISDDGKEIIYETSYFFDDNFSSEQRIIESKTKLATLMKRVFTLTKKPCHLMNPNGDFYLQKTVYTNNEVEPSVCVFWAKIK